GIDRARLPLKLIERQGRQDDPQDVNGQEGGFRAGSDERSSNTLFNLDSRSKAKEPDRANHGRHEPDQSRIRRRPPQYGHEENDQGKRSGRDQGCHSTFRDLDLKTSPARTVCSQDSFDHRTRPAWSVRGPPPSSREPLVRDLVEQVTDTVEARPPLV